MMNHMDMVQIFLKRDSGFMVLLALEESVASSPCGTIANVPYPDIAGRFGVSHAHIHNIINDAETAGLVRKAPSRRVDIELLPSFRELNNRLTADSMVSNERRCLEANAAAR